MVDKKDKILCSICVATFRRPLLLKKLVKTLLEQELLDNVLIEIIIVDNDPNQTAKPIIVEFNIETNNKITYLCQSEQNISLARNLALENAKGQFIAILDDDEIADPFWINNLLKTALMYKADAVFGYVSAVFPENIPMVTPKGNIF